MPAFVPLFAVCETVDRSDRVAAGEVRDPGLLNSVFPCLTGHLAQFGEKTFRLADWRQRACHLPCTDALPTVPTQRFQPSCGQTGHLLLLCVQVGL